MKHINETCPQHGVVGSIPVIDEPGEDCNFFAELKDYKATQRTDKPHRCACGAKLKPVEA